ncbi:MAG: c-type cytochrome [Elusimicrobia bacterium]|nr:c-type cytochrome [Elusimicrobiota bacterium]
MRRSVLFLALLASGCAKGDPSGPDAGKAYFKQAGCLACHKIGAEGSAVGPDLTLVGFRHSAEWLDLWLKDPKAWKADTLMPNSRLSDAARKTIVAYLAERRGQDWSPGGRPWESSSLPDAAAVGRVVYARAGCIGCHGTGGAGGYPNPNAKGGRIPALNTVSEGYSKAELIAKVRKGVAQPLKADPSGPAPLVRMPAWGEKLSDAELDAVASYLLTLSPANAEKSDW